MSTRASEGSWPVSENCQKSDFHYFVTLTIANYISNLLLYRKEKTYVIYTMKILFFTIFQKLLELRIIGLLWDGFNFFTILLAKDDRKYLIP